VGSNPAGPTGALAADGLDRIATIPNALSLFRILMIPVFVVLLLHHGTEEAGLLLLGVVVATDWVDGFVARRTGQVSTLGKLLDPLADRLALAAALIAFVVRDAFPLWAALLVLVRDAVIVLASGLLLFLGGARLDVRRVGKVATLALMAGIPSIAWANFGLTFASFARAAGWTLFLIGIVLSYAATALYAVDVIRLRQGSPGPAPGPAGGYHSAP
jgi:cardiolipin synthase (CMP-forming)